MYPLVYPCDWIPFPGPSGAQSTWPGPQFDHGGCLEETVSDDEEVFFCTTNVI